MRTEIKHKVLAILIAVLMVFVMMPATVLADDPSAVIKVRAGETLDEVRSGEYVENHGTIVTNNGVVVSSDGTITTNNGTVNSNSGTVDKNYGTVTSNHKDIVYNYKNVSYNEVDGTVTYNEAAGTISQSYGNVYLNRGYVTRNYGKVEGNINSVTFNEDIGVVKTNQGTVVTNNGRVITNDNYYGDEYIDYNYGTVDTNNSAVNSNYGTVITNSESGIVHNYAILDTQGTEKKGVVKTNKGTVYITDGTVETNENKGNAYYWVRIYRISQHIDVSSNGLETISGTYWIKEVGGDSTNATVTLTPAAGYEMEAVTEITDNVIADNNGDGSCTLTITSGKVTHIGVPEVTAKKYTVTVSGGSGGGDYATDTSVTVTAGDPPTGQRFKEWTGADGLTFTSGSATTSSATFTMPAGAVTLTATYEDIPPVKYAVTVAGGTGSGNYEEGATVTIKADDPATGKQFKEWTTEDGVTFADATAAETTFEMPAKAVTVTATYEDIPPVKYAVTVADGTGSGKYAEGATVTIKADDPATGKQFKKWTTEDGVTFADATAAETTFEMPAKAVTVTATYEDIPAPPEPQEPVSIKDAEVVLSTAAFTYNGKVQKPAIRTIKGLTLAEGADYKATWSNAFSKNAGTYTVTIEGKGDYTDTTKATYKINKAANPLIMKAKTATVKFAKLKKKAQPLAVGKLITFKNKGQGTRTYKLVSAKKGKKSFKNKFTVNKKNGKVTVKKDLKKGTYKVKINVTAAGNGNYKKLTKPVTVTIKVK